MAEKGKEGEEDCVVTSAAPLPHDSIVWQFIHRCRKIPSCGNLFQNYYHRCCTILLCGNLAAERFHPVAIYFKTIILANIPFSLCQ
jgi:hypothetical protein